MGVRFDSHVHAGYTVPPFYDSMIGKLLVHRRSREEAIGTMVRGLEELRIRGITTTAEFLSKVLRHADFVAARIDTNWIERNRI
jgi:acetyl-CoA carboxylase biotin carboxylase subunit